MFLCCTLLLVKFGHADKYGGTYIRKKNEKDLKLDKISLIDKASCWKKLLKEHVKLKTEDVNVKEEKDG